MSILSLKYGKRYEGLFKSIIAKLTFTVTGSMGISLFVWGALWDKDNRLIYSLFEFSNIVIFVAILLILLNRLNKENNGILCYGFYAVSILDFMNAYYYNDLIDNSYISLKYWFIARLIQIVALLMFSFKANYININKNTKIVTGMTGIICFIYVISIKALSLSDVYNKETKGILGCFIITLSMFICVNLRRDLKNRYSFGEYFYIGLILIIYSETCFTFFQLISPFWSIQGHVLRIFSYIYFYKTISLNELSYILGNYNNVESSKIKAKSKSIDVKVEIILNAVAVPTIILDHRGKVIACSNSYADLVDISYKDIIRMTINEVINIINVNDRKLTGNFNIHDFCNEVKEWLIETPKGNRKYVQATFSIIQNICGNKDGLVCVMQDTTGVKEKQKQLINQEKLALMGQMGATIVHETRNFLTTIKGNSQLIELYCNNDKIKKYAQKINLDTNEVNRIITDFLNLSKPRETELQEVAFNDLVFSMKNTIETSSLMSNVQLILDIHYDERYILCDETQIRQVILNICKNAVEAMDKVKNPTLKISTGFLENNKEVFVKITDNGVGIDKETIKKIGTPFFTTKKTGTGLGLNACYEIIKEHKGRIEIKSELGKGTTFKIIIPYIDEDLEDII